MRAPLAAGVLGMAALLAAAPSASAHPGAIDADVHTAGGRLLGTLHGHVAGTRGSGTFRPLPDVPQAARIVGLRDRGSSLTARSTGLRMTLRISRGGRLRGAGRLGGIRVRARGVGGERVPDLRRGMKMLVVGRPSGEGYAALSDLFDPVRYRPGRHTRHAFLRERRAFHASPAVVFGRGASPATHRLLHAFYGAGKWVGVAPAGKAAQRSLREVHPYVPERPVPALLVRGAGRAGGPQHVKPTVAYPAPMLRSRTARRARGAWFRARLLELGEAHMASGLSARAAASGSSVDFNLPYNAAAIEIRVPYNHEFTVSGAQNKAQFQTCGWNQTTFNAWCSDTWYWQQQSGGDTTAGCRWFLVNGYLNIDRNAVNSVTTDTDRDGAYEVEWGDFTDAFMQWPGHDCPVDGSQSGQIVGNDYYYALYDPSGDAHTLVVLSDPTVSASTAAGSALWHEAQQNGSGVRLTPDPFEPGRYVSDDRSLTETAWFLGKYSHTLTLTGLPPLGDLTFEYSGTQSLPNNEVTYSEQSSSSSTSQGFNVGIFGDAGTGGYARTDTASTSVTVQAPSWQVSPTVGQHTITYDWTTNDPVPWSTMAEGGGGGWGLNPLNKGDFSPAALTVWTGSATCCQVNVASTRVLSLVDHYSRWNGSDVEDRFATRQFRYGDSPDEFTPTTGSSAGPGIDLCDPNVAAPQFLDGCKGLAAAPTINLELGCGKPPSGPAGPFTLSLNGAKLGGPRGSTPKPGGQPEQTYTCPFRDTFGPFPVDPNAAATVSVGMPDGARVTPGIGCFRPGEDSPVVSSPQRQATVTVPASLLDRGATLTCAVFLVPVVGG